MSLLLDEFIVDGLSYDWLPISFDQITTPDFGVRATRYLTQDLGSQVITNSKPITNEDPYSHIRKITRQAWSVSFDLIDQCMYDHLKVLYDTQKYFYTQFDDEMSRLNGALIRSGSSGRTFFTPTYPIKPYGYYPGSLIGHAGNIKAYDGTTPFQFYSGVTITPETGMVTFDNPIKENIVVTMSYTWQCYVRIAGFDLKPRSDIPQGYYNGTIILEQVSTFDSNEPWVTIEPCYIKSNDGTINYTVASDVPTEIQNNSLPGSSGYVTPLLSGTTLASGSSTPTTEPPTSTPVTIPLEPTLPATP